MARSFCDEISKYSQSILANISRVRVKNASQFSVKSTIVFGMHIFVVKSKKFQTKTKKHLPQIFCRGIGMFVKQ